MSTFSAGFPLGNIIGSVLGGIVGQFLSWKWAFWIVAIETGIVAALAFLVIPQGRRVARMQFDDYMTALRRLAWPGLIIITAALVCLLVALSEGNVVGWQTPWVLALLCGSCLLFLPAFLIREYLLARRGRHGEMLVKLALFKNHTYTAFQVVCFVFWARLNSFLVFATYLYQDYQGLNEVETALQFLPSGITGVLAVFASSQIVARFDGYWLTSLGILVQIGILRVLVSSKPLNPRRTSARCHGKLSWRLWSLMQLWHLQDQNTDNLATSEGTWHLKGSATNAERRPLSLTTCLMRPTVLHARERYHIHRTPVRPLQSSHSETKRKRISLPASEST